MTADRLAEIRARLEAGFRNRQHDTALMILDVEWLLARVQQLEEALRKLIEPAAGLIADDHINLGLNDGWALKLAVDATRAALADSEP